MAIEERFLDNLCFCNVSTTSGIRTAGKTFDRFFGREKDGLFFLCSGRATFNNKDGTVTTVDPGELLFIPHGSKYSMVYTAKENEFALVNFDMASRYGEPTIIFDSIRLVAKDDNLGSIEKIMTELVLCGKSCDASTLMRKKELLYSLFGIIARSTPMVSLDITYARIFEGVRLLEETYLENLQVSEFANACHFGVNSFRRYFLKCFGMSPVKYRNDMRIKRAKELLMDGELTVSEVAYSCAFENVGYFCRYYLKTYGETPSETKRRFAIEK